MKIKHVMINNKYNTKYTIILKNSHQYYIISFKLTSFKYSLKCLKLRKSNVLILSILHKFIAIGIEIFAPKCLWNFNINVFLIYGKIFMTDGRYSIMLVFK